jgi:hypothetical protein
LLREFVAEHLHDGAARALTAFAAWDNFADGAA